MLHVHARDRNFCFFSNHADMIHASWQQAHTVVDPSRSMCVHALLLATRTQNTQPWDCKLSPSADMVQANIPQRDP